MISFQKNPATKEVDPRWSAMRAKLISDLSALFTRTQINKDNVAIQANEQFTELMGPCVALINTGDTRPANGYIVGKYTMAADSVDEAVAVFALQTINESIYQHLIAVTFDHLEAFSALSEYQEKLIALLGGQEAYDFLPLFVPMSGIGTVEPYFSMLAQDAHSRGFDALRRLVVAVAQAQKLIESYGPSVRDTVSMKIGAILADIRTIANYHETTAAPYGNPPGGSPWATPQQGFNPNGAAAGGAILQDRIGPYSWQQRNRNRFN